MCVVDKGEEGEGRVGILAELDLLPVIQACRVEGEQIVCPYSLLLLGHLRGWAHLQDVFIYLPTFALLVHFASLTPHLSLYNTVQI